MQFIIYQVVNNKIIATCNKLNNFLSLKTHVFYNNKIVHLKNKYLRDVYIKSVHVLYVFNLRLNHEV